MGLCGSSSQDAFLKEYPRTLQTLDLDGKRSTLVRLFHEIDKDGSDRVAMAELLDYLDLPRTKFLERAFSIFDNDGTMTLDFRETMFCIYHFATLDQRGLGGFMFDLYDTDGSHRITRSELLVALRDTYGGGASSEIRFQNVIRRLDTMDDASITREKFAEMCVRMSEMLYPAVQAQVQMRRKVFGERFWERRMKERLEKSHLYSPHNWRLLQRRIVELDLEVKSREERAELQKASGKTSSKVAPELESQEDRDAIAELEAEEYALATGRDVRSVKSGPRAKGPSLAVDLM